MNGTRSDAAMEESLHGPLVLGGGLAGAAVATLLARAGVSVTLVEQYAEPRHKMCGEFLSTEACESLLAMGMDVRALGAVPVRQVRISGGSGVHAGGGRLAGHALPFEAWSLTRRVLDEAMLEMVCASGVTVRRGKRAEALEEMEGRWRVRMSGGAAISAADVFVASGKHDLRGHARPAGVQGSLIAFKQYFRLAEVQSSQLWESVELILFRGGYAGLQMVERGCANLCLLVEAARYREVGASWDALLGAIVAESEHLRARLEGAEAVLERPLSLSRIPYGYLRREVRGREGVERGLWFLGDQAAVIPSFSGDGMSIALHTARVAAEVYLGGKGAEEMTRQLAEELGGLLWRATAISRMMVSRTGQRLVGAAARLAPSLLPMAAEMTRIPARVRAQLDERTTAV